MWAIEIIGLLVLGVWVWLIYQMWKSPAHPLPKEEEEEEKPKEKEVRRSISKLPTGKATVIGSGLDTSRKYNQVYQRGKDTPINQPIHFEEGNHIYAGRNYNKLQEDADRDVMSSFIAEKPTETFEGFGNGGDNGFGGGGADASWGDTGSSDTGSADFSAGE